MLCEPIALPEVAPLFPHFKPLEMADRAEIEGFTRQFEPYSDFCFSTLVFYNGNGLTRWCWLHGNLVLHLHDGFGCGDYFTLLGCQQIEETVKILIGFAERIGISPVLRLLPERAIESLQARELFVIEERESFDYVYSLEALVGLEGSALSKLRRGVTRFSQLHPDHRFFELNCSDPALTSRLRNATALWQCRKDSQGTTDQGTVGHYCRALQRCLAEPASFDLIGIGVEVSGALEGFAIGERIQERWLLSHFGIANPSSMGCSDSLLHQLARKGANLGCTHLNYQEDLGDPGLRRFKMKCDPSGFLRKFSVGRSRSLLNAI